MFFNIIIIPIKTAAMDYYKKPKLKWGTKANKKEMGCAS